MGFWRAVVLWGALGAAVLTAQDAIPIGQVQGPGSASPYAGQRVTVRGIVTARRSNGFFLQTPDAEVDGDLRTSEGVFIFTARTPSGAASVGNLVLVSGTVQEFQADPNSPTSTEIAAPTVTPISTGNPLPAPVTLTAADTDPHAGLDLLERYEGMRVTVPSLTVVAPTDGNVSEATATATSTGVFFGVITGVPRPYREPGIQTPDQAPAPAPCCIPEFDNNPERLRVDSLGQRDASGVAPPPIDVATGAVITGLTGVLDYGSRAYTILPDPGGDYTVVGGMTVAPVSEPAAGEFTVASFNMERFFDTVNDPSTSDVALSLTAYDNRLKKASLTIRTVLRLPDILAVQEVENLAALTDIANGVNADAVAAGSANPAYTAHLIEGNDLSGIDVGFLVKSARVTVVNVVQEGKSTTYTIPSGGSAILNDRPPLLLRATVAGPAGASFPITVVVNHLRSLIGISDPDAGAQVRRKRRAQAEFLANLVQARQTADPAERILVLGDFNSFAFGDGYVDVTGIVRGATLPAANVTLAGADLVNPDLVDASESMPAAQRYSYVFDGSAQTLDQVLLTQNLQPFFARLERARVNADFPEIYRNDATRPERLSDHDPAVAYFRFAPQPLGLAIVPSAPPVAGHPLTYSVRVWNSLSTPAQNLVVSATVPAGAAMFQSVTAPDGWSCAAPAVGSSGTVRCTKPSLAGASTETLRIGIEVRRDAPNGTMLPVGASIGSTGAAATATSAAAISSPALESGGRAGSREIRVPVVRRRTGRRRP